MNGSNEIVGPFKLTFADKNTGVEPIQRIDAGAILPGQRRRFEVIVTVADELPEGLSADYMAPGLVPILEFRDSAGLWWVRRGIDPIEQLDRGAHELP